ncbi:MAG: erythromycin esterase family protein, partial [Stackebrandtia sp.]
MTTHASKAPVQLSDAAVHPLRTLDPCAPLDDLEWLDAAIGNARVVAIGESAHYNHESFRLRHRLLRYLVERHGFGAYVLESGFTEARSTDAWVRGATDTAELGRLMGDGMVSLMLMWAPMRAHLAWMRRYNHDADRPVGFYGLDLGGSNASLLTGIDAVTAYLARAEPDFQVDPAIRSTAAIFAPRSPFSAAAAITTYAGLAAETRNELTAGLVELAARMNGRRLEYLRRTTVDDYDRARRSLQLTITLDTVIRAMAAG